MGPPTPLYKNVPDMFKWFFPSLPKLPNLKLIVYLPKMFSPAGVPSWSCCPAHCWHSTELRTTHKWPVYWPQVRYTHEHTETHLTMGYEVNREPAVNRRTRPNATDQLHMRSWVSKLLVFCVWCVSNLWDFNGVNTTNEEQYTHKFYIHKLC